MSSQPAPLAFEARLTPTGPGFMPMSVLIVPEEIVEALGGKQTKRVLCTLNGRPLRRALQYMRTGERFLLVSKTLRRELRLGAEDLVQVTLAPDPAPEQVDLPEELVEGLAAWPEAEAAFNRLTPGRQRNLVHYIDTAKRSETRAERVVKLLHQLADGTIQQRTTAGAQ